MNSPELCVHGVAGRCAACVNAAFDEITAGVSRVHETRMAMPYGYRITRVNDSGQLHDGGESPAVGEYAHDGTPKYEAHYVDGVSTDVGVHPAHVWYHLGGQPHIVHHMRDGLLHDYVANSDLVPAVMWTDSHGNVTRAESWNDGTFMAVLTSSYRR